MLNTTVEAYDAKIQRLQAQTGAPGGLAPELYQREYEKALKARQEAALKYEQNLRVLQANVPRDLDGIVPSTPAPNGLQETETGKGLRIAGGIAGAAIALSVFLPAVSVPLLGTVSLIQAANMMSEMGDSQGYIWVLVLLILGIGVAVVSQGAGHRMARGGVLLFLGTLTVGAVGLGLAVWNFYPATDSAAEFREIVGSLTSPGIGVVLLIGGYLATYVLAWMYLWDFASGRTWCKVSAGLLGVAWLGTILFLQFAMVPRPTLAVETTRDPLWGARLKISLGNTGSLAYHLEPALDKNAARDKAVLALQRKDGGNWANDEEGFGLDFFSGNTVDPGKTKEIERVQPSSLLRNKTPTTYRAVLRNKSGILAVSNEITLEPPPEQPKPPAPFLPPSPPVGPPAKPVEPPGDPALKAAREKVADLKNLAGNAEMGRVEQAVRETRDAVRELTNQREADDLSRQIDEAIVTAKARVERPLLDEAQRLYRNMDLDKATELCNQVLKLHASTPLLQGPVKEADSTRSEAQSLLSAITIAKDPTRRYEVGMIMAPGGNRPPAARVVDKLTGVTATLREGDRLDRFTVERIVQGDGVTLSDGRETAMLPAPRRR
jgi:arsenate reductase-like glutaredoxin family protein